MLHSSRSSDLKRNGAPRDFLVMGVSSFGSFNFNGPAVGHVRGGMLVQKNITEKFKIIIFSGSRVRLEVPSLEGPVRVNTRRYVFVNMSRCKFKARSIYHRPIFVDSQRFLRFSTFPSLGG